MERAHARSLLDDLRSAGADLNVGRPAQQREEMVRRERELKTRVASLEVQREKANEDQQQRRLDAEVGEAREALYQFYRDQRSTSPVYRNLLTSGGASVRLSLLGASTAGPRRPALGLSAGRERGLCALGRRGQAAGNLPQHRRGGCQVVGNRRRPVDRQAAPRRPGQSQRHGCRAATQSSTQSGRGDRATVGALEGARTRGRPGGNCPGKGEAAGGSARRPTGAVAIRDARAATREQSAILARRGGAGCLCAVGYGPCTTFRCACRRRGSPGLHPCWWSAILSTRQRRTWPWPTAGASLRSRRPRDIVGPVGS